MERSNRWEILFWSIALPGYGQILNKKYLKGVLFILLEFTINIQANLNEVIISSFYGHIEYAIQQTNYNWLMFYPCIYLFAMWDAYRDAGGGAAPFSFLPFTFSAYVGTIGVIYSSTFKPFGLLLGPIFLSISFLFLGAFLGYILRTVIIKIYN